MKGYAALRLAHSVPASQSGSIAWLFNIRGSDIKYNPVAISYAIVTSTMAQLFVDKEKISEKVKKSLEETVDIYPYKNFETELISLAKKGSRIWVDENSVNQWIFDILNNRAKLLLKPCPIPLFKAVKNETEIAGFRTAHIRDEVAMVRFLQWLNEYHRKVQTILSPFLEKPEAVWLKKATKALS
ncbi:MAG: aminopeptidase P family N-terminal domain-containing protein [Candidatus Aminicenantaceae bacterium]